MAVLIAFLVFSAYNAVLPACSKEVSSAEYTVRVPAQNLDSFLSGIDGMATVVNKTLGEEDSTSDTLIRTVLYVILSSYVRSFAVALSIE